MLESRAKVNIMNMNNKFLSLLILIAALLTAPILGASSVTVSGNFDDDGRIIIPLDFEGYDTTALQMEFVFHPEEMALEEVIEGNIIAASDKQLRYEVTDEKGARRLTMIVTGLNQNHISSGSLATLVFKRVDRDHPGRILPGSLVASDKEGNKVQAAWRDRQRWTRRGSRDDYLMSFSQDYGNGRKVFYQGSYLEKVDLYLKRIYQEGSMKKWDYIPLAEGLTGDISGSYDLKSDMVKGRVLLQVFRCGSDLESEDNLLDSVDICARSNQPGAPRRAKAKIRK